MQNSTNTSRKISRILVANRGEIACRVIRSAKAMGIETVAVFSEIDRTSKHVLLADFAAAIGPAPASQSYLDQDAILQACLDWEVDAIHPGYGFLSENAEFAASVEKKGIVFIGPAPKAIELMGDKLKAKACVSAFGVPLVPGSDDKIATLEEGREVAEQIGYPLLIKAAAGGGGKGMRIVNGLEEFDMAFQRAQSEAQSAFGDDRVFIERFVSNPRHIEFQIMADRHGNVVHLFERECSIQRRHQKVVEEAPSVVLDEALRTKMSEAAINVAKSCDYINAGTVEFILDDTNEFFFLEMNTRLQVEHPVTEAITGIDLVKEQIRVAQGEPLSIRQENLKITGHAIELRVYAEHPASNFLPDTGKLSTYLPPAGPNVRVDDGVLQNDTISSYYDPMISKLICWGPTRDEALSNMNHAIENYHISGVHTTLPYGHFVINHKAFIKGKFDTKFIEKYPFKPSTTHEFTAVTALAQVLQKKESGEQFKPVAVGPWQIRD